MSLINQMLQDLEKRQSDAETVPELPGVVHAAPAARTSFAWQRVALPVLAVAGAAGVFYWLFAAVPKPEQPQLVEAPAAVPGTPAPPLQPPAADVLRPAAPASSVAGFPAEPAASVRAKPAKATSAAAKAALEASTPRPPAVAERAPANIEKVVRQPVAAERAEKTYLEAVAMRNRGRSAEAGELLRKALAEDPMHSGARQLLARDLLEQRAYAEARQVLAEGMQQQPAQLRWPTLLARLELDRGDLAAARQAVDSALPRAGDSADFQALAGAVAQRQGRAGEAADFYRAALRLAPGEGRWWIGLGIALEAEGHGPEAREAFRRAIRTGSLNEDLTAYAEHHSR